MQHRIVIGILVGAVAVFITNVAGNYLAEKPSFLKECLQSDPNFDRCFADDFQEALRQWKDGVPGLKSLGPLDPLTVKRVSIIQDANNPIIQLNANLLNLQVHGVSQAIINEAKVDMKKAVGIYKFVAPKIHINADYTANGHIFNLALDSNGKTQMSIENVEMDVAVRLKIREEYGLTFTDVDKIRVQIANVGGFKLHLDNLFHGQKDIEESTHVLINENWHEFYEVLRPAITEAFQAVYGNWLKKTFAHVPISYFIGDLTTDLARQG